MSPEVDINPTRSGSSNLTLKNILIEMSGMFKVQNGYGKVKMGHCSPVQQWVFPHFTARVKNNEKIFSPAAIIDTEVKIRSEGYLCLVSSAKTNHSEENNVCD